MARAHCELDQDDEARRIFELLVAELGDLNMDNTWLEAVATSAAVCAHLGDRSVASACWRQRSTT